MPTVRCRKDLQDFVKSIIPCPDRFPEWYNEPRSDLSGSSFREIIKSQNWAVVDSSVNALETAGQDTITSITSCI